MRNKLDQNLKLSPAEKKAKWFQLFSTGEKNLRKAEACERLERLAKAQNECSKMLQKQSEEKGGLTKELIEEIDEQIRDFYEIPESVFLFEGVEDQIGEYLQFWKPKIKKVFEGRMNEAEAGCLAFEAVEGCEYDLWWVLFGEGVGYYGCPAECDVWNFGVYEEVVKFATRNR